MTLENPFKKRLLFYKSLTGYRSYQFRNKQEDPKLRGIQEKKIH